MRLFDFRDVGIILLHYLNSQQIPGGAFNWTYHFEWQSSETWTDMWSSWPKYFMISQIRVIQQESDVCSLGSELMKGVSDVVVQMCVQVAVADLWILCPLWMNKARWDLLCENKEGEEGGVRTEGTPQSAVKHTFVCTLEMVTSN